MLSGSPSTKSAARIYFEAHSANVRALEKAITRCELLAKRAVREGDDATVQALGAVIYILNGVWTENRLRKLVWERGLLNDAHRRAILETHPGKQRPQEQRWFSLLDAALLTRYGAASPRQLATLPRQWRKSLRGAIGSYIKPIIDDRNAYGHGGWVATLSHDDPIILGQSAATRSQGDDYLTLRWRREAVDAIAVAIREILVARSVQQRETVLPGFIAGQLRLVAGKDASIGDHDPAAAQERLRRRLAPARTDPSQDVSPS